MTDLKEKAFKTSAFEPTEDEFDAYIRSKRREKNNRHVKTERRRTPSPARSIPSSLDSDSSDDDLPDVADMFVPKSKSKGKQKAKDEDGDVRFLVLFLTW